MSKIKKDAERVLTIVGEGCELQFPAMARKQALRALRLEKAYRYHRAASRLRWAALDLQASGDLKVMLKFVKTSIVYDIKAAELYRQAEEV